ncbi:hypothetical protein F0562_015384 [Nyssa sinensis]|uniref:Endonuclease/exonuclease/phosphatase domain-containing protein n=1 Tax=Nyssa sinensis TaxID=561372 RepID=A0A5J4ZK58_9ASTE|nr:hypothetical protein F0562_015384 [Nyssa sinensis]
MALQRRDNRVSSAPKPMFKRLFDLEKEVVCSREEADTVVVTFDDVQQGVEECERSLIGRIATDKSINLTGLKKTMSSWGSVSGLQVGELPLELLTREVGMKIARTFGSDVDVMILGRGDGKAKCLRQKMDVAGMASMARGFVPLSWRVFDKDADPRSSGRPPSNEVIPMVSEYRNENGDEGVHNAIFSAKKLVSCDPCLVGGTLVENFQSDCDGAGQVLPFSPADESASVPLVQFYAMAGSGSGKKGWKRRAREKTTVEGSSQNPHVSVAVPPRTMKLISWNCRGLGNPRAIRALHDLVKREAPILIFLLETKIPARRFDELKFDLGFPIGIAVDSCDAVVEEEGVRKWRISGFYGSLDISGITESWDFLRMLKSRCSLLWLCFGDFNEMLSLNEKRGMASTPNWQLRSFREVVNDCGFRDLGFSGFPFTWSNNRVHPNTVLKRLDRFLATTEWVNLFPNVSADHLIIYDSDHVPSSLVTDTQYSNQRLRRNSQFRFEAM